MSETREVRITGGTAALCFWLFVMATAQCDIAQNTKRIATALEAIAAKLPDAHAPQSANGPNAENNHRP